MRLLSTRLFGCITTILFEFKSKFIIHLISSVSGNGKVVEIKDICANFTTDMIGNTAFGVRVNSLQDPKATFREYGRMIFDYDFARSLDFTIIFFFPNLVKYIKPKFFGKKPTQFLRTVFWDVINQRIESGQKRGDLIDVLIEMKEKYKDDETLTDFSTYSLEYFTSEIRNFIPFQNDP